MAIVGLIWNILGLIVYIAILREMWGVVNGSIFAWVINGLVIGGLIFWFIWGLLTFVVIGIISAIFYRD